jgi:hypothetical protein
VCRCCDACVGASLTEAGWGVCVRCHHANLHVYDKAGLFWPQPGQQEALLSFLPSHLCEQDTHCLSCPAWNGWSCVLCCTLCLRQNTCLPERSEANHKAFWNQIKSRWMLRLRVGGACVILYVTSLYPASGDDVTRSAVCQHIIWWPVS